MRVTLGLSVLLFATLACAQSSQLITEYAVPYAGSHPQAITLGSDHAIWFTDPGTNSIGRVATSGTPPTITEFPIPTPNSGANGIAVGDDRAIWFAESNANKVGRIAADGTITEYSLPTPASSPTTIAGGFPGVWFTESSANQIGSIGSDGTIREFPIPTPASTPSGISPDSLGSLWFTELNGNKIANIAPNGTITEYPITTPNAGPLGIGFTTTGLWIADSRANQIAFFPPNLSGPLQEYPLPVAASGVSGSAQGCFTLSSANMIICYIGDFTEYPIPTPSSNPQGIAFAPPVAGAGATGNGGMWFAEAAAGKIGWLNVLPLAPPLSYPSIYSGSTLPIAIAGTPYSTSLLVKGGTPPYTWSVLPGSFPAGLVLSNVNTDSATLSGTMSSTGLQKFAVSVTDSLGNTGAQAFSLQVDPASCTFALSSSGESFPAVGGVGTFSVTAPPGCSWTVVNSFGGVTILDGYSGSGSGSVHYEVSANDSLSPRSAPLNVSGQSFTVQEEGGIAGEGLQFNRASAGVYYSPEMPHLAVSGGWRTSFTLVNTGSTSAQVWTSFYGDDGNLVDLLLAFPNQPSNSYAKWIDRTLAPNQSLVFESSGPASGPLIQGLAAVSSVDPTNRAAHGSIPGFSIFHYDPSAQEAVVPLGGSGYVIPFDNTNGVTTGIAIASSNFDTASYPIILLDDTGARIGDGTESITLPGYGHTSFVLSTQFPITTDKRGTMILGACLPPGFHVPSCTALSTLGIRYTPPGTLTTIPALGFPSIGVPPFVILPQAALGGTMPHIASGNGWQTTFVLSNVPPVPNLYAPAFGSSAQDATLNFFDDNGNPLTLPLTFPQTGATMTASSVTQTVPANGTLYIQTSGDLGTALLTGSAQLTGVNGFAIFRYNPNGQEAVVPIQNTPNVFTTASVLAFDNTSNTATGVAISNGSPQAVSIPVTIRDDQGNQIGVASLPLAANGHTSFMLDAQYPATANIRGMLEFAIPGAGTSSPSPIAVLGIRSPPQLTFTTLPALPK